MRLLLTLLLCAFLFACEEVPVSTHEIDRRDVSPLENGSWESSPWPWIVEEPQNRELIEIPSETSLLLWHGLERIPAEVHCYVGFSVNATWVMPASGNSCEIRDANDQFITIRNGSGGSFFYRFVLR